MRLAFSAPFLWSSTLFGESLSSATSRFKYRRKMDDIWDEPAVIQARPTQNSTPLFDFSNEEDPVPQPTRQTQPKSGATTSRKRIDDADIDQVVAELFDDIDDPTQDDTARQRELVARKAQLAKSASEQSPKAQDNEEGQDAGAPKPTEDKDQAKSTGKRVMPKVDEERYREIRSVCHYP
jgi:hypothetical protein